MIVARTRLGLLGALLVVLLIPAAASAHARITDSVPASDQVVQTAPSDVTLTFSEPVETALGAIRVFDGAARRVDSGGTRRVRPNVLATDVRPGLAAGTYTVSWRVASADGHPIDGAFVFHVGAVGERPEGIASDVETRPSTAVARTGDVARFLNLALVVMLIGAVAANLLIFEGRDRDVARTLWYVIAGLGFGLSIVAAGTVVIYAAAIAGAGLGEATNASTLSAVVDTRFGRVRIAQLVAAEVIAIAAVWAPVPSGGRWLKRGIAVLAVGLAVTPGLSGHAGASGAWTVVADTGHVLAASVWVGGLVTVILGLALARDRRRALARTVLPRYSTLAVWSVAGLLVAGTLSGLAHVGRIGDLWGTTYGKLVLTKIAIALVLIGFGVANRRLVRRLAGADDGPGLPRGLQRSVAVEFAVMAVAIGVTSVLITKPPARALAAAEAASVSATGTIDDVGVRLTVDPGRVGANRVTVVLTRAGAPATVDEVTVRARATAGDTPPVQLLATAREPGRYATPDWQAATPGVWAFEVAIRRGEFDLDSVTLELPIAARAG